MRAVIYARYSCDNQREESIEGQLRECREFAIRKGYTLVGSYIDRAVSAKTDNRPEFQRMIKESSGELFDMVIVWKLDRFARNRYDSAHYKAVLRKNGVKVISATEAISDGAEGIILESVLEGYAEYYSAELSEKVIRGMTENALKCQYNGGFVPVGYKIDENKHYQIDELTAPFIKEAFLMYVNGRQIKDIVKYLNDNEVRSSQGNKISKTAVTALLQNRKYIGEYSYRDVVVPNGVPAIISKELFALAMDRLEKNKYAPSSYKADERYLLSTKLICGCCGATMVGESGTGRNDKKYHYYKCSNAKRKKDCKKRTVRKADIEEAILQKTVSYVFDKEIMDGIVSRVLQWQERENTTLPLLQRELAEVERSLSNVMSAIEQGIINPTTKKRMDELTEQKTDLEVKIAREEIQEQILTKEQIEFWLSKMVSLDLASRDNKQRILGVDMLSASAHKFNGPKGIGFLYNKNSLLQTYHHGGAQELGMRAGTENVPAIVGMAVALRKNVREMEHNTERLAHLSEVFLSILKNANADFVLNGHPTERLPGNVNISFKGKSGEGLLHLLDLKGICISTGSACDSQNLQVSHVIKAIDVPTDYQEGTIRVSFGSDNTEQDAVDVANTLLEIIRKITF